MILSVQDKDLTLIGHVIYCVSVLPSKLVGINSFDFNIFLLKNIYTIDKQ